MPTAQKSLIQVELGQSMIDFQAMADSGDQKRFTIAGAPIWSGKSGFEIDLRPNGIKDGVRVVSPHASNDTVQIDGFTAYSQGTEHTITAQSLALTRPATQDYKICSIVMTSAGAIAEVEGSEGASFSDTRDAAGGPPLIPVDDVEIAQVRFSSQSAAVIPAGDIFQDANIHAEYYDYPSPEIYPLGKGMYASVAAEKNAFVEFNAAFPLAHTGDVPKRVYAKVYAPNLTTLPRTDAYTAAEVGVSKSSETMYEGSGVPGAVGAMKADSVGDAKFTVFVKDGITDPIVKERNEIVTVKYFPDANKSNYLLTQGMLGFDRQFPAGEQIKIEVTVYCEQPSVEFSS